MNPQVSDLIGQAARFAEGEAQTIIEGLLDGKAQPISGVSKENEMSGFEAKDINQFPHKAEAQSSNFAALKAGFDGWFANRANFYTQNKTGTPGVAPYYHGTASMGYYDEPMQSGLATMHQITDDIQYLQYGVDIALEYINAGVDRSGTDINGNALALDGKKDWFYGEPGVPAPNLFHHLNKEHYEWRGAMGIALIRLEMLRSGVAVTPSSAAATIDDYLRVHVWDKWNFPNPPSFGAHILGRSMPIAVALDKLDATPGSNVYATWIDTIIGYHVDNLIANGGTQHDFINYNTGVGSGGTSMDISHFSTWIEGFVTVAANGYSVGGKVAQGRDILIDQVNNVIWPAGQTHWNYRIDGSGGQPTSIPIGAYGRLFGNDPALLARAIDYHLTGTNTAVASASTTMHAFLMATYAGMAQAEIEGAIP